MLWWDRRFLSLGTVHSVIIYLYSRYIDDENMAGKPLAPPRHQVGGGALEHRPRGQDGGEGGPGGGGPAAAG